MAPPQLDHAHRLLARALPALTSGERHWVVRRLRGELRADETPPFAEAPGDSSAPRRLNHFFILDSCLRRMQHQARESVRGTAETSFASLLELMHEAPLSLGRAGACVCLNVTHRETAAIDRLFRIWSLMMKGKKTGPEADLAICFDKRDSGAWKAVTDAAALHGIEQCFGQIQILEVGVPEAENVYYRHQSEVPVAFSSAYGWKSGPNHQFFRLLRHPDLRRYAELLLVETDCFPAGPHWIRDILADAHRRPDFWVLGSPFRGRSRVGPDILLHLNGVAVYRTAEPRFFSMLAQWEDRLKRLCVTRPETAYDCAQELYFWEKLRAENWHALSPEDVNEYYDYRRMFVITDCIVNLAGEPERQGVGRYTLADAMEQFPQARLFHANYLSEEAARLAEKVAHEYQ